jgi:hypothetical protein
MSIAWLAAVGGKNLAAKMIVSTSGALPTSRTGPAEGQTVDAS